MRGVFRRRGGRHRWRGLIVVLAAAAFVSAGCGKKGPPLAPLHLVPAAPTGLSVRVAGADVKLRLVLPSRNENGEGRIELDRLEIYAVTIAPGAPTPPNRELLTTARLVGTVPVRPAPAEGEEPPASAAADTRPLPGETITFTERLTDEKRKPVVLAESVPPPLPVTAVPPPATAVVPIPTYPVRIYAVRGVTRGGRPGTPASRVQVPLVSPPLPPTAITITATEAALALGWTAPPAVPDGPAIAFNVSEAGSEALLNPEPLSAPAFERPGVTFGVESCFTVRSVITIAGVAVESEPSAPACLTPKDTFPPAAPKGLTTVSGPGAISLLWDANLEPDLAGYVVLRGEAPGGTLQPLTETITSTRFEDKTVKPGVRYIYAVVAVDKSMPPNTSAPSPRQEETAR